MYVDDEEFSFTAEPLPSLEVIPKEILEHDGFIVKGGPKIYHINSLSIDKRCEYYGYDKHNSIARTVLASSNKVQRVREKCCIRGKFHRPSMMYAYNQYCGN